MIWEDSETGIGLLVSNPLPDTSYLFDFDKSYFYGYLLSTILSTSVIDNNNIYNNYSLNSIGTQELCRVFHKPYLTEPLQPPSWGSHCHPHLARERPDRWATQLGLLHLVLRPPSRSTDSASARPESQGYSYASHRVIKRTKWSTCGCHTLGPSFLVTDSTWGSTADKGLSFTPVKLHWWSMVWRA